MSKGYLSYEEQFEENLNNEQIERIKDNILRNIRCKYWNLRHAAFLDESGISDTELKHMWDDLKRQENDEIIAYRKELENTLNDK